MERLFFDAIQTKQRPIKSITCFAFNPNRPPIHIPSTVRVEQQQSMIIQVLSRH